VHRQRHNPVNLGAVRVFAVILPPRALLREADQVGASYVVVMPKLAAPHAGEKRLCEVRVDLVRTAEAIGFFVIDTMQRLSGVQRIPRGSFVGIQLGSTRDLATDEGQRLYLAMEHARQRPSVALADHDYDLALA